MSVFGEIENLKSFLLERFKNKIESGEKVGQYELEKAIEDHQGCTFPIAKHLINLLWECHANELVKLYRLIDPKSGLSIEIKKTIEEAHKH